MKTLIFTCTTCAFVAANAGTVAWYSMTGTAGTRSVYTEHVTNRANPGTLDLIPGTIWNNQPIIGSDYNDAQKNARTPIYTNAFPSAWSLYDPVSGVSFTNETAFAFRYGDTSDYNSGSFAYVENDAALHLSSFTVEFFVKFPLGYSNIYNALAVMPAFMPCRNADSWGVRAISATQLQARFTPPQEITPNSTLTGNTEMTVTIANLCDGMWHHVALTFDNSDKTARLYFDYELKKTQVLAFTPWYTDNTDCRMTLGGSVETVQNSVCDMDEFRLSDTALPVEQFLRFRAADRSLLRPDTAFCFAMDCEEPWFGDTNRVNNLVDGATLPGKKMFKMLTGGDASMAASSDVPAATLHPSITDEASATNRASTYNTYEGSAGGSYISVVDPSDMFRTNSFTVECFFKGDGNINTWTPLLRRNGGGNVQMNLGFGGTSGMLSQTLLPASGTAVTFADGTSRNDGKWHHAALVVDRERKLVLLYCDYQLLHSGRVDGDFCTKTDNIHIGGNAGATFKGWLNTFRISLAALRPSEFVTANHVSGSTLGWARYETLGALDSVAGMQALVVGTGIAGAGGTAPVVTSGAVPRSFLQDGADTQETLANAGGLSFANGYIIYPENPILGTFADDTLTVEFFMKASQQANNTPLLRCRSTTVDGSDPIFALSAGATAAKLQMRYRLRNSAAWTNINVSGIIDLTLCDEKWHHVALSLARKDYTNTLITLYKDYAPAYSANVPGIINFDTGKGNVIFGGSAGNGLCYTGLIDELRISRGDMDEDDFLRACGAKGFYLFVR